MRTFLLTFHLTFALFGLAAAALVMVRMGLNLAAGHTTDPVGLILLGITLLFAGMNIARTIIITAEKP